VSCSKVCGKLKCVSTRLWVGWFFVLGKCGGGQVGTYKRNTEARSRDHCCRAKTVSITYSERASVALVIQLAKRMRRIILSSVAYLAVPYFSILSHKRYHFRNLLNGT
jgi:hypothetical protein